MKSFGDVLSPRSWLFLIAGFVPMYLVVFRPTLWEFVVFHIVEFMAFNLTILVDRWLFLKIYPSAKTYFPKLDIDALENLPADARVSLFQSMIRFPLVRALYCTAVSYPKMLLSATVVVFYWKHDCSNWMQFLKFFAVESVMFSYFYGALFIEFHELVSRKLAEIHQRHDWTDTFRRVPTPNYRGHFELQERLAFTSAWIFMLWAQALVAMDSTEPRWLMGIEIGAITLCAGILMARLWYLSRNYFFTGLWRIFQVLDTFRPEMVPAALPLSSSFLLARFGQVFNQLLDRLHRYEQELSHWIFVRSEQSRYRALGEISGLIVHDLTGPLHVLQFCSEQLKEKPERIQDPRYAAQLSTNSARALELIHSLRAYLQNPRRTEAYVTYDDVEPHIMRLLEAQFSDRSFQGVRFEIDPRIRRCSLRLTQADLIHIMLNLYSNSIRNLLDNQIPNPQIKVFVADAGDTHVTLGIWDNGTGLSIEKFEQLTAFAYLPQRKLVSSYEGLGLRLIRRLVERNNGTLTVVAGDHGEQGTLFHIRLDCVRDTIERDVLDEITQAHLDN